MHIISMPQKKLFSARVYTCKTTVTKVDLEIENKTYVKKVKWVQNCSLTLHSSRLI